MSREFPTSPSRVLSSSVWFCIRSFPSFSISNQMIFDKYTHNGMNLRKSVNNPRSRFERIRSYLLERGGSATKVEILRDVFGKEVETREDRKEHWQVRHGNGKVTHGWGTYVFNLGVKYGYFTLVRKNRTVYWTLNPLAQLVPLDQADGAV